MFRRILCPVDFSECSRTALRYARELARRGDGTLTVFFANDPLLGAAAAAAAYDVRALAAKTDKELRRFVARSLGVNAKSAAIVTALGHPAPAIRKAGAALRADLIVMGSRGITGPGKWLFGSTTERVLRDASRPVLVIPAPAHRRRARWANRVRAFPGGRVLVPVDLDDYSLADLRAAVSVARSFQARVTLMFVVRPLDFPSWLRIDRAAFYHQRKEEAQQKLVALAGTLGDDVDSEIGVGDPVAAITSTPERNRSGLIVLTTRPSSTALGPRQGAIAYRVMCRSRVPVLAIPTRRKSS